ncbi:MAG TPA: type II secretion protein F [Beutenbergiaceae bacterium]|nr:type II secretion protein F [Beutenbergiaceae bacterium]
MTRWRRAEPLDLGAILTEVAARLQAGAPVDAAWSQALPTQGDVPETSHRSGAADGVPVGLRALREPDRRRGRQEHLVLSHQVAGAEVACQIAHTLGTPLAGVLEACAEGVSEAGRAHAARRSAVAAPRATARLLGWLPVAGLVLGSAWGADPVQVLFDGGWGTVSLVIGAVLMGAGHLWASKLVRRAEQVGA